MNEFTISDLEAVAISRPLGYLADCLAAGERFEDENGAPSLRLSSAAYRRIAKKYQLLQPPPIREQLKSLRASLVAWNNAGRPITGKTELRRRRKVCQACPFWKPSKVLAFSSCAKCGCKGLKLWLRTEGCPIGRW